VAGENARREGLVAPLDRRLGSLFEPVREDERFDVVVSNPPYVAEGEFERDLAPELVRWEPREALVAGPTGLEAIEGIVRGAPGFLLEGGLLALEIGETQGEAARRLVDETGGFAGVEIRKDLAGRDRVLMAERRGP
jgi:release factor glutamine methyltransferase